MWHVLVAAAIAGSGYIAINLLYKHHTNHSPIHNNEADTPSIFPFSSAPNGPKNVRKKLGRNGGTKGHGAKVGSVNKTGDVLIDDCKKIGRKSGVTVKKRRTGKNASAKCNPFDVKDKSSFSYGVGIGIMCMMSAGKAEIKKLNAAVDETTKLVQELEAEISKRKSLSDLKDENTANIKWDQTVFEKSVVKNGDVGVYGFSLTDEGEYASSILTEEPHRDVAEMEQLEAELESELLKLQVSDIPSSFQKKTSTEDPCKPQDLEMQFNQGNGVIPYELDQKLCHLLIEQQESQIVDLESELQRTNSKLLEKESELQALKDCVKRLSDFSVTCPSNDFGETETISSSDEETEGQFDEAHNKMIYGNRRSMAGIKRAIDFD